MGGWEAKPCPLSNRLAPWMSYPMPDFIEGQDPRDATYAPSYNVPTPPAPAPLPPTDVAVRAENSAIAPFAFAALRPTVRAP
jgi:hypothetical protein